MNTHSIHLLGEIRKNVTTFLLKKSALSGAILYSSLCQAARV